MANTVPDRAHDSKRKVTTLSADGRDWPSRYPDAHIHTDHIDPDYGYELNEHGEWSDPEKEDAAAEMHLNTKDCKGTGCIFPTLKGKERHPYQNDEFSNLQFL